MRAWRLLRYTASLVGLNNMKIMTGIEVNYFPQLREYCPSAEGTWAIFPQLTEIKLTSDR